MSPEIGTEGSTGHVSLIAKSEGQGSTVPDFALLHEGRMSTMPRNSDASKALRPTQIEALRKSIEFEIARIIANNASHVNSYVLIITSESGRRCASPQICGTSAVSSAGLALLRWGDWALSSHRAPGA